jgi:hypothetical protein
MTVWLVTCNHLWNRPATVGERWPGSDGRVLWAADGSNGTAPDQMMVLTPEPGQGVRNGAECERVGRRPGHGSG